MGNEREYFQVFASQATTGRTSFVKAGATRLEWSMGSTCWRVQTWSNQNLLLRSNSYDLYPSWSFHHCPVWSFHPSGPAQASPQKASSLPHLGRAFTEVQEKRQVSELKIKQNQGDFLVRKAVFWLTISYFEFFVCYIRCLRDDNQVAGGCDFILKVMQAFSVPTIKSSIMMDMHGVDGFASLACVEDWVRSCLRAYFASDVSTL